MPFNYAQINGAQRVVALSALHSEVITPELIALDENKAHNGRTVKLGDAWTGAEFVEVTE